MQSGGVRLGVCLGFVLIAAMEVGSVAASEHAVECDAQIQSVRFEVAAEKVTEIDLRTVFEVPEEVKDVRFEIVGTDLGPPTDGVPPRLATVGSVVHYEPDHFSGTTANRAMQRGFVATMQRQGHTRYARVVLVPQLTASELALFSEGCRPSKVCGEKREAESCPGADARLCSFKFDDEDKPRCKDDQGDPLAKSFLFRADGILDLAPCGKLREDQHIEVRVLAREWFKRRYVARITGIGETPSVIRGEFSVAKAGLGDLLGGAKAQALVGEPKNCDVIQLGRLKKELSLANRPTLDIATAGSHEPVTEEKLKISSAVVHSDVNSTTEVPIDHRYALNIAALAIVGPTKSDYSVKDGKIARSEESYPLDFLVGLEVFPTGLANPDCSLWDKDRRRNCGRFFGEHARIRDRFSLIFGFGVKDFGDTLYLGVGYEVFNGVQLSVGWLPRREQSLQTGYSVGDVFSGTSAPTDKNWELTNFGIAFGVDTSIIKSLSK
jgi:hypothetical protein